MPKVKRKGLKKPAEGKGILLLAPSRSNGVRIAPKSFARWKGWSIEIDDVQRRDAVGPGIIIRAAARMPAERQRVESEALLHATISGLKCGLSGTWPVRVTGPAAGRRIEEED